MVEEAWTFSLGDLTDEKQKTNERDGEFLLLLSTSPCRRPQDPLLCSDKPGIQMPSKPPHLTPVSSSGSSRAESAFHALLFYVTSPPSLCILLFSVVMDFTSQIEHQRFNL